MRWKLTRRRPTAKGPAETFTGAGYHAPRTGSR